MAEELDLAGPGAKVAAEMSFGALLRQFRVEAELTQEGLAEVAQLNPRSVQKLERGDSLPYPVTVQRLARALHLNTNQRAQFQAASVRAPRRSPPVPALVPAAPGEADALPRGAVTVLVLAWRTGAHHGGLPEVGAPHRAELDAILPSIVAQHGGALLPPLADRNQRAAVFPQVRSALAATLDVQRTLRTAPNFSGGGALPAVAVHSAAVSVWPDDGIPVLERAVRLLTAAQGGQVLVSSVTADLAAEQLPPGTQLEALGAHRLGDLARPEHLYQLVAPELLVSFTPPRPSPSLDSHYEAVTRAIVAGRVVLFLGEEINLCGRGADIEWQPGNAGSLPTGGELAAHLAAVFGYPDPPSDLMRVAQYVAVMAGSGPLYDALHRLFDVDYQPNPAHAFVAALPDLLRERGQPAHYPLIVTTNFDDTLERAFSLAGEPVDLVGYAVDGEGRGRFWHQTPDGCRRLIDKPNKYLGLSLDERPVILKIHGAVDRLDAEQDSFVITEDDYLDYLTRADISNLVPVTLAARLRRSHYLFLGYSLRDWNSRVILRRLWGEQRITYKSWASQLGRDALEQELWRQRDVDVLRVPLEDYLLELQERFFTVSNTTPSASTDGEVEP